MRPGIKDGVKCRVIVIVINITKSELIRTMLIINIIGLFFLTIKGRKEGNVLFNDALNTFYLRLYGVRHNMVKYHTDSERGIPLPPHVILFPISSNISFICIIPQTG